MGDECEVCFVDCRLLGGCCYGVLTFMYDLCRCLLVCFSGWGLYLEVCCWSCRLWLVVLILGVFFGFCLWFVFEFCFYV